MREIISLNGRWNFFKGDIKVPRPVDKGATLIQCKNERKHIGPAAYYYFDKPDCYYAEREMHNEGWRYVTVPHDYIFLQDNDKTQNNAHGYLKYDNAWYRKEFSLDAEKYSGKRIFLQFDGVATHCEVYLNGSLMKRNFSAYNGFEIDITNNVYFDRHNVIAVYVNTEEFEGWWYQGGGIYRDVRLVITEPIYIARYGVYAPYEKMNDTDWKINFHTTVCNKLYESAEVTVINKVIDANGVTAASAETKAVLDSYSDKCVDSSAIINNPNLWNIETPNLYTVKTTVLQDGNQIDENEIKIGFRTFEVSAENGFLINGIKTIIKGVNAHQDFGLTGIAVPKNINRYKIDLLKQMGANGYRTSHYEQTADILDALDEKGFIVIDETRWFETTNESFEYLNDLVMRDRNRPSVFFWSTGNEEITHLTDEGKRVHREMAEYIRKLDNTRLITTCEDKTPTESKVFGDCDVIAINYNLESYDAVHTAYPDKAIMASECCATGTSRGWFLPTSIGLVKEKDVETNSWYQAREKTWKHLMERPYVIGGFQWVGFDHRGEAMWPGISSTSGAFDLFLQKKSAFYQNKSYWTSEPIIHIVSHWNFEGLEGTPIDIDIYTNSDETELFLNGKSLGRQCIDKYCHGHYCVEYCPGELKAVGYKNGKIVCEDERITSGAAKKLQLKLENSFETNGKDLAMFTCECLDENGLPVPDAAEYVYFSTDENAEIVGTGSDERDHKCVSSPERQMFAGKISVAVKPKFGAETFSLYAKSNTCGYTVFTFQKVNN